jgi:hypothetical protein
VLPKPTVVATSTRAAEGVPATGAGVASVVKAPEFPASAVSLISPAASPAVAVTKTPPSSRDPSVFNRPTSTAATSVAVCPAVAVCEAVIDSPSNVAVTV